MREKQLTQRKTWQHFFLGKYFCVSFLLLVFFFFFLARVFNSRFALLSYFSFGNAERRFKT